MHSKKRFLELLQKESKVKPFSFLLDGVEMDLNGITPKKEHLTKEKYRLIYEIVPDQIRLVLEVMQYEDFPVIEYTPYFENPGNTPSGIISRFQALDMEEEDPLTFGEQKLLDADYFISSRISVRYHLGSNASGIDFLPQKQDLFPRAGSNKLVLECHGAWCSTDYLPFFGIDFDTMHGINLGIGWNGSWRFSVEKETGKYGLGGGKTSRIQCGMKETNFRILPGERLMQPGILLHFREEKNIREGQNEFRRFMLAHNSPRNSKGELLKPPLCFCAWGGLEADKQIERLKLIREKKLPYESLWIDAGWMGSSQPCPHFLERSSFKSDWFTRVGSWELNRHAYPDGLHAVSEEAEKSNLRVLLWFETERISSLSDSPLITEHPQWLLGDLEAARQKKGNNLLLNLGIPEAREYLTNQVIEVMEREKIHDYREDRNIDIRSFWQEKDTPERVGTTEMKYVEGFYLFWTALRKHFPDSFIDNCSGGGRRLDYKTAALSFPMCQSDYACYSVYEEECITFENMNLDEWLPLHGTLNWGEEDPYHAACALGYGYGSKIWQFNGREPKEDHDYATHRKLLEWGKLLRDMHLKGDVYPLVDSPEQDMSKWNGQQTHVPCENAGTIQIYRRKQSPAKSLPLSLQNLLPEAEYQVKYFSGKKCVMKGKDLQNLVIELEKPGSFEFLHYKMQAL